MLFVKLSPLIALFLLGYRKVNKKSNKNYT